MAQGSPDIRLREEEHRGRCTKEQGTALMQRDTVARNADPCCLRRGAEGRSHLTCDLRQGTVGGQGEFTVHFG